MSKMVQIRNVPEEVHRKLKAKAARLGLSLSDYLLSEVRQLAATPTLEEMLERLDREEPLTPKVSAADIVRTLRDA